MQAGVRSEGPWARLVGQRRFSFEAKLVVLCLVSTISALIFTVGLSQWESWRADRKELTNDQAALAWQVGREIYAATSTHDERRMALAAGMVQGDEHAMNAVWFPEDGRRVQLMTIRKGASVLTPGDGLTVTTEFDAEGLLVRAPCIIEGRRVGELVLRAHTDEVQEMLTRNSWVGAGLAVVATLVSLWFARSLARRTLRPLYALQRGILAVRESHDFSQRVEAASDDEFGRVAQSFNMLLAELTAYDARLQNSLGELTDARDVAEAANVLKSRFLANMSHEIRTPLNGIVGMTQILTAGRMSPTQREQLQVIEKSGGDLLLILNDILDLSKIEAGRMELEAAPFDIAEVIGEACSAHAAKAEAKGLSFSVEVDEAAEGVWCGDAARTRQVIDALVSNALKFTSQGEVRVRVAAAPAGPGKALAITVSDTGIGIPADIVPRLFEKFVQADSSATRRFGGAGLGLTICRHVIDQMGGAISVRSVEGEGSAFEVRLPLPWLGPAMPEEAPAEAAPSMDLVGLRVLAAEDNATNRLVLDAVLRSLGVVADMVEDGAQAVEAWRAGGYDLILMDIQMPLIDGVAATEEIRRLEAVRGLPHTPIFALTANVMAPQVAAYLAAGMDGHLAKPIDIAALYAVLEQVAAVPVVQAA